MRKVLLILSLLILSATIALAQERSVSGTVTSTEDGESIPGVNVVLKGTTSGTVTNIDGMYSLDVPSDGGILVFSFIGFASQEVQIGNQSTINIILSPDVTQLGEVIVVGYGTTLKKEFTGSSASVSGEDISRMPIMSANQALQGQAAGVFVGANSGTPGGGITVRVRGSTSISASNDPLYIIDGVPVVSGDLSIEGFGGQETSAMSALNPQDIASIEVLKDASSTAIYGARAANGVVIITTKRGKRGGGLEVNYSGYVGWSEATNVNDILTAQEWVDIKNEARTNDGLAPRTNDEWGWDGTTSTDWIDEVFRTGFLQEHQLSASGGGEKTRYYMSGSFRDEEGAMLGSDIKRSTFRVNLDHNATEKVTLGSSISYSHQLNNRISNDNNIGGVLSAALLGQPILPVYTDETESEYALGGLGGFLANPVQAALVPRYDDTFDKTIANFYFNYDIVKGLSFRYDLSMDINVLREDHYEDATTRFGRATNGRGDYNTRQLSTLTSEPTLRYNTVVDGLHKIDVVLGTTWLKQTDFSNQVAGEQFARTNLSYITSAATVNVGSSFRGDYRFTSIFSRVSYSYNSRYLFSLSYRRDGSSRFGPDNRHGNFGAISAGWVFSDESFADGSDWLSLGKLRGSYGIVGNDQIGNFQFVGSWTGSANYLDRSATAPNTLENNELKWEETSTFDIGLDLGFLDDRVTFTTNYFKATTNDLLYFNPIPETTGFAGVQDNIGTIENKGWEFELGAVILPGELTWSMDFNIAFIRNEVVELLGDGEPIRQGFGSAIVEGEPLNSFFLWESLGVDPATGNLNIRDTDGDGNITADDQLVVGSAQPDYMGGFNNNFSWKGLTLSFFFQFVQGNEIYNNTQQFSVHGGASSWGMERRQLDRWQNPGDITDVPRAATTATYEFNNDDTSRFLDDGSYVRLKNLTLAYNLPVEIASKLKLVSARFYVTGQNIWTQTDYKGFDPEISTFGQTNTANGTDFLTFPQAKMWTIGLNLGI